MLRSQLIAHLFNNACQPSEHGRFEEGEFWVNLVTFDECYIPFEDEIDEITYCDILYELGVSAPNGCEEQLERFQRFRKDLQKLKNSPD